MWPREAPWDFSELTGKHAHCVRYRPKCRMWPTSAQGFQLLQVPAPSGTEIPALCPPAVPAPRSLSLTRLRHSCRLVFPCEKIHNPPSTQTVALSKPASLLVTGLLSIRCTKCFYYVQAEVKVRLRFRIYIHLHRPELVGLNTEDNSVSVSAPLAAADIPGCWEQGYTGPTNTVHSRAGAGRAQRTRLHTT